MTSISYREAATAEGIRQLELACLPTSLDWKIWFTYWKREVEQKDGWERALVDAISRLQTNQITLARMIRNEGEGKKMIRYNSDGYVWGEELRMPDEITREALRWYITQINPVIKDENGRLRSNVPEWAQHLFKAVEGCYLQQARFGIELSAIKRKGYATYNHSATVRSPESFDEAGTEII